MNSVALRIMNRLGISKTMLGGLLRANDLESDTNQEKLITLCNFIDLASQEGIPDNLLLNLLHEPLEEGADESSSILHEINVRPKDEYTKFVGRIIISRFLRDIK